MYSDHRELLSFYSRQSSTTDPGAYASEFSSLPAQIPQLARVAENVVLHFLKDGAGGISISKERHKETNTRRVELILERVLALNNGPLDVPRPPDERFVGCCRDHAVLLCAMLRHHGIPARARCGFARYLGPEMHYDHWVCEHWDAWSQRWVMVDPGMLDREERRRHRIHFDPLDVPHTQFLTAGKAWQMCRIWGADPERFGAFPGMCGLGFVAAQVVRDLACLNTVEMLAWDRWQLAHTAFKGLTESDLELLDRVAALTLAGNEAFDNLRALYETTPCLRVPSTIYTFVQNDLQAVELVA